MGVALYIVPEREVPGFDTSVSGKALGRSSHLDRLAQRAGVRPLMGFFSIHPEGAAAFINDHGGELSEGGLPGEQWFAAEDGLATVRGLLRQLAANPSAAPNAGSIAADLREFEAVLTRLAAEGVRWHLAVDY
jgi:hypothetical protein